MTTVIHQHDRLTALKAFDATKSGVKGLVDTNITKIPAIFHHPNLNQNPNPNPNPTQIPKINLSNRDHLELVQQIKSAAETFGIFQVVDHGIDHEVLDCMLQGIKSFHEADVEVKKCYYSRDSGKKVVFNANTDLFQSQAAHWRDSLICMMAPVGPEPQELPLACREITIEYANHIQRLGVTIFELMSEALGLDPNYLSECAAGLYLAGHYYPSCPEPHLTLGSSKHSDPCFLTILLQDNVCGLQILHEDQWIGVPFVHGALVVNVGDFLQIMSNDKFKSVEHRVVVNELNPRVSVGCFFSTRHLPSSSSFGPIKELISDDNPPMYKKVLVKDYFTFYMSKRSKGETALEDFKIL